VRGLTGSQGSVGRLNVSHINGRKRRVSPNPHSLQNLLSSNRCAQPSIPELQFSPAPIMSDPALCCCTQVSEVATAAEPRPNAYIPEDIGIPKPYGGCAMSNHLRCMCCTEIVDDQLDGRSVIAQCLGPILITSVHDVVSRALHAAGVSPALHAYDLKAAVRLNSTRGTGVLLMTHCSSTELLTACFSFPPPLCRRVCSLQAHRAGVNHAPHTQAKPTRDCHLRLRGVVMLVVVVVAVGIAAAGVTCRRYGGCCTPFAQCSGS
jgi:hypothetical protein